jgi:hypothetical protein
MVPSWLIRVVAGQPRSHSTAAASRWSASALNAISALYTGPGCSHHRRWLGTAPATGGVPPVLDNVESDPLSQKLSINKQTVWDDAMVGTCLYVLLMSNITLGDCGVVSGAGSVASCFNYLKCFAYRHGAYGSYLRGHQNWSLMHVRELLGEVYTSQ